MFGLKNIFGSDDNKKSRNFSSELVFEEITIRYNVEYSRRKLLTLLVRQPDGEVIVKSPYGMAPAYISRFVENKSSWIIKHLKRIEELKTTRVKRDYSDNSEQLLLGKPYTLRVVASIKEGVKIDGDNIVVYCRNSDRTEFLLKKWQVELSRKMFMDICRPIIDGFGEKYNIYPSLIECKFVKGYWGQCTSKRVIRLNVELIRAPKACIEYIIMHELCHLVHQNHSADFWALVKREMPDFKKRKELLEKTISCKY